MRNLLHKNIIKFEDNIDFNFVINLLNNHDVNTDITSNYNKDHVFNSCFRVHDVHIDPYFKGLFDFLEQNYNPEKIKKTLMFFLSFTVGCKSTIHKDPLDVYIIGAHGITVYICDGVEYRVEPGDMLYIPKNMTHTAVSLSPRIILSYG
tara:strand:+ start:243 stop:689 length:447 start_codon:yes stop_codon:yes gene_type:complete